MSDEIIASIVTGATGIIGVAIGLGFTGIKDYFSAKKDQNKIRQIIVLDNMEGIQECIESIMFIFEKIDNYACADFSEKEDWFENAEAITGLAALRHKSIKESWIKIRKIVYQYFPYTVKNEYFNYFSNFMNTYDDFLSGLNDQDSTEELQEIFRNNFNKDFYKARYFTKVFEAEFKSITLGKNRIDLSDAKKYKRENKRKFI